MLCNYWKQCGRLSYWLFPGQKPGMHIMSVSVHNFLKIACQKAGIKKAITVHTLHHCFATHMLEIGVSIFAIKILLGYAIINSTCRYLHLVRQDAFNISSPLDYPDGDNNIWSVEDFSIIWDRLSSKESYFIGAI